MHAWSHSIGINICNQVEVAVKVRAYVIQVYERFEKEKKIPP